MSRLQPLKKEDVPELAAHIEPIEKRMGFTPNSLMVMARRPKIVKAFAALSQACNDPDNTTSSDLRRYVAFIASQSAGCQYCMAHTASTAHENGIPDDKIEALWQFESSPLFTEAERSALRFAQAAATVPSAVTGEDIDDLKKHYDDGQIVEIMAVVAYFGFLNRWNDSMMTELEDKPKAFASKALDGSGWDPARHAAE